MNFSNANNARNNYAAWCCFHTIMLGAALLCNGCTLMKAHQGCAKQSVRFDDYTNYFHVWKSNAKMTVYTCDGSPINPAAPRGQFNTNRTPILLLHELPGMTPECLILATNLAADGFTVHVPLMFGKPDQNQTFWNSVRLLFNPKWNLYHKHRTSAIAGDLRKLTQEISQQHQQKPMAVIGMCLTGSLPLALLSEPNVMLVVLSQPATPLWRFTFDQRAALALSPCDLRFAEKRVAKENIKVIGLRFAADRICQAQRFENLQYCFGTNFLDWTIPLRDCPPDQPHSVLCENYDNTEGSATRSRLETLKQHLAKLKSASVGSN